VEHRRLVVEGVAGNLDVEGEVVATIDRRSDLLDGLTRNRGVANSS
jgi:hypothetical protein